MSKRDSRGRPALMASVALAGLVFGAGAANAQGSLAVNGVRLDSADLEDARHGDYTIDPSEVENERHARAPGVATTYQTYADEVTIEDKSQIVIAEPGTPITSRDPVNINGIGQMIVSVPNPAGGVGLGLCTGTLINPRTVLFAAHCVNTRPATDYGSGSGGVAIGFGFNNSNNSTQPGQPAGTSPLLNWLFGTETRAANLTSTEEFFYTVNGVVYNPLSLEPAAAGFLYGDVAIASLDTPASDIPTWAILLSALTPPQQITAANGTGYHVTITGYGRNGIGTTGATGAVDHRRRIAENWLGALTSLNVRDTAIFGGFSVNRPQNLYWIDFDDPRRGTSAATPLDFNLFRDNALPNEGGTSGGNSGGPLILDRTFAEQVVIGVLSGGSRFFPTQPGSSYGTPSFYQPIYLYWDWIAANNPYRYVGARTGNGNWEDASRWVTLQDPNYRILDANGQLVTGTPTTPGEQNLGSSGQFGELCIQGAITGAIGNNVCLDLSDGTITPTPGGIGSQNGEAVDTSSPAQGFLTNNLGTDTITRADLTGSAAADESHNETGPTLPSPTIANGLPGATNFVPNNTEGNRLEGVLPRYFDVRLSNAGVTTLSSAATIDRLTVTGPAGLTIAGAGSLTSLIDITQVGGMINVMGSLNSVGDYTILSGMLQGSGTITAPFVNSVAGTISPGTMGTTGTLTIDGNLVLASGTQYLIDINGTASDRITVTGEANVGGLVVVGTGVTGQVNGLGRQFTILSATDGVTGTFTAQSLSPILRQAFTYQANAVLMQITAASYNTVIDPNSSIQVAYAQLFDQNRANTALASLYGLDFASTATIRATFTGLAPVNEQAVRSLSGQSINLLQNFNDVRLREADRETAGGKIAIKGSPLNVVQAGLSPFNQPTALEVMALQSGTEETEVKEANLPENLGIFLAGGFLSGNVDSLPGFAQRTEVDGFYIAGGLEFYPGESTLIGLSGYYSALDANAPLGQSVDGDLYAVSIYARHDLGNGPVVDGQISLGSMGFDTVREVQFLAQPQSLTSASDDLLFSAAVGLSYDLKTKIGTISPVVEGRYASVNLSTIRETGGTLALALERETFRSTQARGGLDFEQRQDNVRLNATAQYVVEFEDGPQLLNANFAQGTGPNANFVLDQADDNWFELGVSVTIGNGPLQIGAGFDTTLGRDTADARAFRGTATYRF